MSLEHEFAIIKKSSNENTISSDMESISISDSIITYIGDTLKWIYTNWNGKKLEKGINYYGYSIIENEEIEKLLMILKQWRNLFYFSPDECCLSGSYLVEENEYEQILLKKEEIIQEFNDLIKICEIAFDNNMSILHNGI